MTILAKVNRLRKYFPVEKGFLASFSRTKKYVHAVDDISFSIDQGETFGLVGESGSGKTTTGRLMLRLLEPTSGSIQFSGQELAKMKSQGLREFRRQSQIIFQDPMASLNPRMKIGEAIKDALDIHNIGTKQERRNMVLQSLERVGLTPAETFYNKYPHQVSGGQRQRAVIGRAIVFEPKFIVADEPVAMVDVSIRAQILDLMTSLKKELGLTYLFVTHDLATANYFCDRIAVMYLGKIAEVGLKQEVFNSPKHPYTVALMSAIPVPDPKYKTKRMIPRGEIPSPINPPSGCRFNPRCPQVFDKCPKEEPELIKISDTHYVSCHLFH